MNTRNTNPRQREGQAPSWPNSAGEPDRHGSRPSRKYPSHGVRHVPGEPTIIFVTVCTRDRRPWLATETPHDLLRSAWLNATAWLVGRYVIMPDHVHFFAAPGESDTDPARWIRYWKAAVSRRVNNPDYRWQKDYWDTRMRSQRLYQEKWDYVRENPVRHGLVAVPDDWPHQGELHDLPW